MSNRIRCGGSGSGVLLVATVISILAVTVVLVAVTSSQSPLSLPFVKKISKRSDNLADTPVKPDSLFDKPNIANNNNGDHSNPLPRTHNDETEEGEATAEDDDTGTGTD